MMLYRAIVERIQRGEGYYESAATEQRTRAYPTSPPQVFREPTLAWALALMRTEAVRRAAIVLLSLGAFVSIREALVRTAITPGMRFLASCFLGTALLNAWAPTAAYGHEIWASYLIAISLALNSIGFWRTSILLAVTACLIRELALPYVAVMGLFAIVEGRYRELLGWIMGAALFLAVFAWHLFAARALHASGDYVSPAGFISADGR